MWPFGKRKRREAEQDAEYQAFLENHQKQKRPPAPVRAPSPPRGYSTSAGPYSGISCTYVATTREAWPPRGPWRPTEPYDPQDDRDSGYLGSPTVSIPDPPSSFEGGGGSFGGGGASGSW